MTAVSVILSLNPHLATDLACNYFNLLKVSSKCVTYIYKQRIHTSTENSNAQPCKDIVVLFFWVDIIHVYGKVWEKSLGLFKVSFMTSCDTIRNRKNSQKCVFIVYQTLCVCPVNRSAHISVITLLGRLDFNIRL